MKKKTKKILIGTGIAAAGAALVGAVHRYTTKYLMKLALDREAPKSNTDDSKKVTGAGDLSEFVGIASEASKKLEAQEHETVEIIGNDGTRLVGHWFGTENAKRIIIAMHGWRSTWNHDFGVIAPFWLNEGCAVLFAEQRGQGESGGDYMGFGLLERYDCMEWIKWVNERTEEKLPIYLGGVSMGATTILMTSGFELPENVCGIVADCGFTSPQAIWKHVVENNMHIPYGIYKAAAEDICKKKINVGSESYSTTEALKNCTVPILFIHGTDDHFVPVEMTYENYKSCVSPKELLVVPGAEHGMSYLVDTGAYENAIKEFWNKYDFKPLA